MSFQLKQNLKLSQQLIMTPQLQQAIKLLQLSRLELVQTVQQALQENPLLEEVTIDYSIEEDEEAKNKISKDIPSIIKIDEKHLLKNAERSESSFTVFRAKLTKENLRHKRIFEF